jgi:hypothetical protein
MITGKVLAVLEQAACMYDDTPRASAWLANHRRRFEEPLRIAVTGKPKVGRSTLITALDTGFEGPPAEADAVLYLMGHAREDDLRLLWTLREPVIPMPVIAVLSRADEIGGGRVDAMSSAKLIARRYRADTEVGAVCQNVIAVAGLLACAGRTLSDQEYGVLAEFARLPRAELDELVLSADRFVNPDGGGDAVLRQAILDRFGLFGVRLATTLIRRGCANPSRLAAELVQRSGLNELREAISRQFTERAPVLKARTALIAVDTVLRNEPRSEARTLQAEVERILVTAQDFRELELLAALTAGRVKLPAELVYEAERLLGRHGTSPAQRLGVDSDELATALAILQRWQRHAVNPGFHRGQAEAARTVVHSCEGIIAQLIG